MAILSTLVFTGVLMLRGSQVKKQSKAAAEILAEGFRLANLRARAQGFPVAVAIPTDIGKTPIARGYYFVEGEADPPLKRGYDFGAELPDAIVFSGQYPGPAWTPPLATVSRGAQFSFEDWYPPFPSDAYFVFLPTGEVVANHSAADGSYRVVVATRVSYTPPVPGPDPKLPPEAMLTGVSDPYTITITTQGQVEVQPGLVGGSAGLVQSYRSLPRPDRVAFTPPLYVGPNRPPVLAPPKLVIEPNPNQELNACVDPTLPAITMLEDGQVQLTFFAVDPDGDRLQAAWQSKCVEPATGCGDGSWSTPPARMRWSYTHHAWYRTSTWTPPPEALPNYRFLLTVEITDGRGGLLSPSASTAIGYPGAVAIGIDVRILPRLRLAYNTSSGLKAANFDGTAPASILTAAQLNAGTPAKMSWAGGLLYINGTKPLFLDALDGTLPGPVGNDTQFDGIAVRGLSVTSGGLIGLVEHGTDLEVQRMDPPPVSGDLRVKTPRGMIPPGPPAPSSLPVKIPISACNSTSTTYSLSENTLLASDGAGNFTMVWLGKDPMVYNVVNGPPLKSVVVNASSNKLYGVDASGQVCVAQMTLNGSTKTVHFAPHTPLSPAGCSQPALSPDGKFLVYQNSVGNATLYNINSGEEASLDLNGYTDMVWSQE